jgi:hypothetical protein
MRVHPPLSSSSRLSFGQRSQGSLCSIALGNVLVFAIPNAPRLAVN